MPLTHLEVSDFRCLEQAELELHPRLTIISGPNASGKTTLLESVFFLSCGRSFRTHRVAPLIRTGAAVTTVVGRIAARGRNLVLGARADRHGIETRISGEEVQGFAEHARLLPVQAIDPEIHKVLEEGPVRRRRYLDWGVFHVEHSYVTAWRRYQRALKQRNAALKRELPWDAVTLWDRELLEAGERIADARSRYLAALEPLARDLVAELLGVPLELVLEPGWSGDREFADALRDAKARDLRARLTSVGPHRGDVAIRVGGAAVKDRVSRGQQKLLAAALILAQLQHRLRVGEPPSTLLIDDPAAELDKTSLQRFLGVVRRFDTQLIVTTLDPTSLGALDPGAMFHVERGKVTRVV